MLHGSSASRGACEAHNVSTERKKISGGCRREVKRREKGESKREDWVFESEVEKEIGWGGAGRFQRMIQEIIVGKKYNR